MKVQFIFNKVQNKTLANLGIVKYKEALESIGYTADFSFRDIDKTFTTYEMSSDVVGEAISIRDEQIGILMENGYRLSIFMLGETSSTPPQSNPVQLPLNKNGNTAIIIPEEWYGTDDNASNVLCEYLLHETAHAGFFFAGKPDRVHTLPDKYSNTVDTWRVYYLDLLKELKPFLDMSSSTSVPTPQPTLKRGSRGNAVKDLQRLLGVSIDGSFGPKTEAAVKAFQKTHKLVVDGIVGPKTWAELKKNPK